MNDITPAEFARGKKLAVGAVAAPVVLTAIPAIATFLLVLLAASGPPVAAVFFFVGMIVTIVGLLSGLIISGILFGRRAKWTREMRANSVRRYKG